MGPQAPGPPTSAAVALGGLEMPSVLVTLEIFPSLEDFQRFSFARAIFSNALRSRFFSGFDLYLLLTLFFPYLFPVSPRLCVSVVNIGSWVVPPPRCVF